MDNESLNTTMRSVHAAAMVMAGLVDSWRCIIEFDVLTDEHGVPGPFWTIKLTIPLKDKRRNDEKVTGSGETLPDALDKLKSRLAFENLLVA